MAAVETERKLARRKQSARPKDQSDRNRVGTKEGTSFFPTRRITLSLKRSWAGEEDFINAVWMNMFGAQACYNVRTSAITDTSNRELQCF